MNNTIQRRISKMNSLTVPEQNSHKDLNKSHNGQNDQFQIQQQRHSHIIKSDKSFQLNKKEQKKKYKKKQKPLTQQQIQVFRQAFEIFDSDHSGSIDESELKSLMAALGYDYNEQQMKRILEEIDEDGSGVIEMNEFVEFMSKHMLDTDNIKKQMKRVFKYFDDDNAGCLDFRKLKNMTKQCFFNLDDDSIMNMLKSADIQGDGKISEYEFLRIMKKVKLI